MDDSPAQLRTNRIVMASVGVAALSVTAFSLLGIASLLGWLPQPDRARAAAGTAAPSEMALIPGESLVPPVAPPSQPAEPLMPKYSAPAVPKPAPPPEAAEPEKPRAEPPPQVAAAPKPASRRPAPPRYQRHPTDTSPHDPAPRGRVTSITAWPDRLWEVRVRFEDGPTQTFRYRSRPPFRVGDPVRLDDEDFLVHD